MGCYDEIRYPAGSARCYKCKAPMPEGNWQSKGRRNPWFEEMYPGYDAVAIGYENTDFDDPGTWTWACEFCRCGAFNDNVVIIQDGKIGPLRSYLSMYRQYYRKWPDRIPDRRPIHGCELPPEIRAERNKAFWSLLHRFMHDPVQLPALVRKSGSTVTISPTVDPTRIWFDAWGPKPDK